MRLLLIIAAVVVIATPAVARPTEVDTGDLHHQRAVWLRWDWMVRVRIEEQRERREQRQAEAAAARAATAAVESTPPPVTYPAGVLTAGQVAGYARGAGFPASVVDTMVAIAWRESRFNPAAVNTSSGACGLWQLYPCPGSHALDPATNAALAFAKYRAGGLAPWGF